MIIIKPLAGTKGGTFDKFSADTRASSATSTGDERKRLTRRELVGTGSGVTEVSVALPTRLRAAGIFVQQRMTIDSQIGDHVSAFDTTSEVQEYVQLQFWCCGHRDCARVLVVGRDGCVNEQLLRVAETHVQELHGENALERDDE